MFEPDLARGAVRRVERAAFTWTRTACCLRSLIVQLKIIPLPVYLRDAAESETREVIVRLGQCIRNNAATNIFNKDLDSRNYGVGRYGGCFCSITTRWRS